MAAAIFFVSGGPLCGGPPFFLFVPPRGGGGFSVGVLRACVGVFGGLHKKARAIRRLVSSPPYEKHDITICIKAYICVVK